MGKASSNKKVARAAGTGGGRTARGRRPWLWYGTLTVFVALGVMLIAQSRAEYIDGRVVGVPPTLKDHFHAAYGFYLCDEFVPGLEDKEGDALGIHSHGDGLIHTHPSSKRAAGKNATLQRFFDEVHAKVTATSIEIPGRKKLENGDKCGGKRGEVVVKTWKNQADAEGTLVKGSPGDVKIDDGLIVTIAFVPEGTELQRPPSVTNLAQPSDLQGPAGAPPAGSELPPGMTPPEGTGSSTPEGSPPPASTPPASTPPASTPASTPPQ